ncbi:MAG: hypothetical protein ACE5FF_14705, partial [Saprospiraceae bacterium]
LFFDLKNSDFEDFRMQLFSGVGQLVRQSTLTPEAALGDLPGGVYFLRIENLKTGEIHQQKIFVTRN